MFIIENFNELDINARILIPMDCYKYCVIESDGNCYSQECELNSIKNNKEVIAKEGCRCFTIPEFKEIAELLQESIEGD